MSLTDKRGSVEGVVGAGRRGPPLLPMVGEVRDNSLLSWTESRAGVGQTQGWRRPFPAEKEPVGRPRGERACGVPETGRKVVWRLPWWSSG